MMTWKSNILMRNAWTFINGFATRIVQGIPRSYPIMTLIFCSIPQYWETSAAACSYLPRTFSDIFVALCSQINELTTSPERLNPHLGIEFFNWEIYFSLLLINNSALLFNQA
jgi:hypothetical protein